MIWYPLLIKIFINKDKDGAKVMNRSDQGYIGKNEHDESTVSMKTTQWNPESQKLVHGERFYTN